MYQITNEQKNFFVDCGYCVERGIECQVNTAFKKRGRPFGSTREKMMIKKMMQEEAEDEEIIKKQIKNKRGRKKKMSKVVKEEDEKIDNPRSTNTNILPQESSFVQMMPTRTEGISYGVLIKQDGAPKYVSQQFVDQQWREIKREEIMSIKAESNTNNSVNSNYFFSFKVNHLIPLDFTKKMDVPSTPNDFNWEYMGENNPFHTDVLFFPSDSNVEKKIENVDLDKFDSFLQEY